MPCFLCGKKADQHVAVASRASSAPSSSARHKSQKQKHSKSTDHPEQQHGQDFDEDFAALQKWRETHSPKSQHSASTSPKNDAMEEKGKPAKEASPPAAAAAAAKKGKKKKKFMFGGSKHKKDKSKNSSPSSSGSGSSSNYNLGVDATKQPVKMSPRAIQAWQQNQPRQVPAASPLSALPPPLAQQQQYYQSQSDTPPRDLRSPYDISSAASSDSNSLHSGQVTARSSSSSGEKKKPPRTQHSYGKQGQQQEPVGDMTVPGDVIPPNGSSLSPSYAQRSHTTALSPSHIANPPRAPVPRTNSWRKRHDHESLKDQLIRDVVLRQNSSSGSSSSNNSYNNNNNNNTGSVGSGERIRGQVFLQVNPMDAISPRSSIDETEGSGYMDDDMASVSDIFSDHHLSTAFTNTSMDSSSRERYILACRLLRARMMQKNPPPIMPMERDLLQDLLERFETSKDAGSQVAYETLAKILEDSDNQKNNNDVIAVEHNRSAPMTYARSRSNGSANSRHSAGNLLDMSREGDLSVASIREEETGFSTSLKHHNSQSHVEDQQQYLPPTYAPMQSWKDEKNLKAMPHLIEEDDKMSSTSLSSMIRLDGWNLTKREQYPFEIMGLDMDTPPATRVLTPALMEALRGFFPYSISEANFWLKFSLVRDGASLRQLLHKCMASQHTVICVETNEGDVFGSFCSTGWKNNGNQKWFGSGEAFLWRLKQSRYIRGASAGADRQQVRGNEMEVYPYCPGNDDMVQYCTPTTLAVGGGSWNNTVCPYPGEPTGIGLLLDGDLEGGETNSCATFANPRLCGRSTTSNEFTIRNVEVWTLTPCDSIPMAEQLEQQKYFVKEQSERSTSPR